jgi:hypothetical protein
MTCATPARMTELDPASATHLLSPEALDQLRQIGLRLDREGHFWHRGALVTHQRLHLALLRWLDVVDGRNVVRLDEQRFAYVDVEDAHLRARSARWHGDRCWVTWDDESEEELAYGQLQQAADHALYVPVRGLIGRIASPAYQIIVERVEEDSDAPTGFVLVTAAGRWPIAPRQTQ